MGPAFSRFSQGISCLSARGRAHIYCTPRAMVRYQAGVFPVLTNFIMPTTPRGIQTRVGRNVPLRWIQLHALSFVCVCVCVCIPSTSSVLKNKQGRALRGLFWSRSESVESESQRGSVVSDSLWPCGLCSPWNSQARILEWVAFPYFRGSSQPRDWTQVSFIVGRFFISWATREAEEGTKSCIFILLHGWYKGFKVIATVNTTCPRKL